MAFLHLAIKRKNTSKISYLSFQFFAISTRAGKGLFDVWSFYLPAELREFNRQIVLFEGGGSI